MTDGACHICGGPLELRHAGTTAAVTPDQFVPTNHEPGQHGDLFACIHCGTVHQPGLPAGEELAELYREMSDDRYLAEEEGRRATARRLLDLIQRHVPRGRAARRGLRARAAARRGAPPRIRRDRARAVASPPRAYARDVLGLDVRDEPVERVRGGAAGGLVPGDRARRRDRAPRRPASARSTRASGCSRPAARSASSLRTRRRRPRGSPARAGGATSPHTPTSSRAGRCASCSSRAGS